MMTPTRPDEVLSRDSGGQGGQLRLLSSSSSGSQPDDILLPAVRIRRSSVALYGTILLVCAIATVDTMR